MAKTNTNNCVKKSPKTRTKKSSDSHGQATRARIVSAAVEAFAERGFTAASTRDIAHRAGTDQGLLTYYFPSKDELWRAAADQLFGEQAEMFEPLTDDTAFADSREIAREGVRIYVRYAATHPEVFRFMVDEGNQSNARMRWLVDTYLKPRYEWMKTKGVIAATGSDESLAPCYRRSEHQTPAAVGR